MTTRHSLDQIVRGLDGVTATCEDCPPVGYPTDETRCLPCPRRKGTSMTNWHERTQKEIGETDRRVSVAVAEGMTPTDAINREAHTTEAYSAMLKKYGLSPVIPD